MFQKSSVAHCRRGLSTSLTTVQSHDSLTDKCEELHQKGGQLVSTMSGYHADSDYKTNNSRNMNGSKMERPVNKADNVRGDAAGKRAGSVMNSLNCIEVKSPVTGAAQKNTKECSNTTSSTNSNVTAPSCRRSRQQVADALYKQDDDVQYSREVKNDDAQTVQETVKKHETPSLHRRRKKGISGGNRVCEQARDVVLCRKEKNDIVQTVTNTKKNDRKRKHKKVDKTGRIPSKDINVLNRVPTRKCTRDLLRTEKVVQCKKTKTEDESTSLNSTFIMTVKPSRKEMGFLAGGDATGKQAGNIMREEKKSQRSHVTGAAKKTYKEHSSAPSCTNFPVTRSQLRALYKEDDEVNRSEDENDVTKTVCDTDTKHDISLSCSGFGMTLISSRRRRALVEDSKECEHASDVVHCSEGKNDVAETVTVNVTSNTRTNKNNRKKKNDEAKKMSSFHMTLRPTTRQQYSLMARNGHGVIDSHQHETKDRIQVREAVLKKRRS